MTSRMLGHLSILEMQTITPKYIIQQILPAGTSANSVSSEWFIDFLYNI